MALTLDGTKGETFPSWTTATRPASPVAGQVGYNTTTGQLENYNGSAWVVNIAATSQGTSGQYLQSAGAGAAPTWATLSSSGALIRAPQILTSGTSYTTPSNCTAIYVEAVGGGGGGGGCGAQPNYVGGAGAAGAYCAKYFTVTGSTAYTYAIGAAGTGGSAGANSGTAGGITTFTIGATTITATGGTAGASGGDSGSKQTAGVTATNGDINGGSGQGVSASASFSLGGSSVFGGGGSRVGAANGTAANGYGAGGAGGQAASSSAAAQSGGNGSQGIIRIWEFT